MKDDHDISVSRAMGRFLGYIWGGVAKNPSDVSESERKVINHQVEEQSGELGDQKIVLKRTTIEEIEIHKD